NPSDHRLIQAAVHDKTGWVLLSKPVEGVNDYGQAVLGEAPPGPSLLRRLYRAVRVLWRGRPALMGPTQVADKPEPSKVRAITLNGLLKKTRGVIDLIDADIQGAEGLVFEASAELVDRKVKRVFIGTHPNVPGVEDSVRG